MRFLLYPARTAQLQRTNRHPTNPTLLRSSPKVCCDEGSTTATMKTPLTASSKVWGQQCSPNCGCVVRFEGTVVNDGGTGSRRMMGEVTYHAKTVVCTTTKVAKKENDSHLSQIGELQPLLTRKGRPMLRECSCKSLHHLASLLCRTVSVGHGAAPLLKSASSARQREFQRVKSDLEFQSIRSSEAFRRAVLLAQGLPSSSTHCFDVVEEAFTAMIKGHMVRPRRQHQLVPPPSQQAQKRRRGEKQQQQQRWQQQQQQRTGVQRHQVRDLDARPMPRRPSIWPSALEDDRYENENENYLSFGQHAWWAKGNYGQRDRGYSYPLQGIGHHDEPRTMSTLRMFDMNAYNDNTWKLTDKSVVPFGDIAASEDWVSYVDEMHQQLEDGQSSHDEQSA